IRYGLKGSIQEKEEAMPALPEIKANIGVIQQSEAAAAVSNPAPKSPLDSFFLGDLEFVFII
ncbi:hypothetical protein, partial [Salegentibacter mishustinae]